ncbi:MAG: hypothetical protein K2K58_07660 [Muribaculaceae bacterium]|nr:hypothetical protein [Muribaculaceae bacterium]
MTQYKKLVSANGGKEIHAIITITDNTLPFSEQTARIKKEYDSLMKEFGKELCPVFIRWFLSDAANQAPSLPKLADCAVSIVEQPPLNLTKAALWVWLIEGVELSKIEEGVYAADHGNYRHILSSGNNLPGLDSDTATYQMLKTTDQMLRKNEASLLENCVRTWFFVQNVDVNYSGVVSGRNRAFEELGLTPATRFIASTGIGGRHAERSSLVQMDSYSVKGILPEQMKQIGAPEFLNPTFEYGVAFERATGIDYGDRRHLFVSGTASIDSMGDIVWEGDVKRQTLRMWENVEALLGSAGCGWEDVGHIIVYLRDPADNSVVKDLFAKCFPDIPFVIVLAPVCRPGWLIEMECMAMRPLKSEYPDF